MFALRFTAKSTQWGRDFRLRDTKELDWYQIKVKKKITFGNTRKFYDMHHEPVNSYILAVSRLKSDVSLRKHAYSNIIKNFTATFPQYFLPVARFSCLGSDQIFTSR